MQNLVRARRSFVTPGRQHVRAGAVLAADHPIVSGREALFEPVDEAAGRAAGTSGVAPSQPRRRRRGSATE